MRTACFRILIGSFSLGTLTLSGCSQDPAAKFENWSLVRNADHKGYTVTGILTAPAKGYYNTILDVTYSDGCKTEGEFLNTIAEPVAGKKITYQLATKRQAASAHVYVWYAAAMKDNHTTVFDETKVIDPSLHPPEMPAKRCSPKPNPEYPGGRTRNQAVAMVITSTGYSCARVTDLYPDSAGQIIAHCVKYKSGRGRATYKIDPDAGQVELVD